MEKIPVHGLGLHLLPNPAKTWSFTGTVPISLVYRRKDGLPLSEIDATNIRQFGAGLFRAEIGCRVFATRQDAVDAAGAIGCAVCSISTCACAKYDPARLDAMQQVMQSRRSQSPNFA